jgi:hypothetical protein
VICSESHSAPAARQLHQPAPPRKKQKTSTGSKTSLSQFVVAHLTPEIKSALLTWVDANSIRKDRPNLVYKDVKDYMALVHKISVL